MRAIQIRGEVNETQENTEVLLRKVCFPTCTLPSEFIRNYPTWSLVSSRRREKKKKKPDKNKPNQNTADCSMLSVSHLKGEEKEIS